MFIFNGRTHAAVGIAIGLLLIEKLKISIDTMVLIYLIGLYIGTLLPDADHKHAPMGKFIPLWLFLKHRTLTHSIFMFLFPVFLLRIFGNQISETLYFSKGMFLGIACHIGMDLLNPTGCPLLYPLMKQKFNILRIKTGSKLDDAIFLTSMICITYIIYQNFFI
ncbi:metal-dependent hydrolase [Anaeromicrobium sediminis]|uniref:metal-dependent hydrolase n=1 Tax=Anaeromicrobium sediminis TaxID=1478221 RepID=UPI00159520E5|nr:metal-dependent hydrolase [Anaeromicrobium sediminis]